MVDNTGVMKLMIAAKSNVMQTITKVDRLIKPKGLEIPESIKPNSVQIALWALFLVATIILSLLNYQTFQFATYKDDASYVILARSLVYSDQYGMINQPGDPGVTQFPFGYPLILAPFVLLFPNNWDVLRLLSLVSILFNATVLFWGWKWFSRSSHWWALAIVGLYLLSPMGVIFTRQVMSEPIFISFCLISILFAERAARARTQKRWWLLVISIAMMFTLFIRTIGVTLVFSIFIYWIIVGGRRFWKEIFSTSMLIVLWVALVIGMTSIKLGNLIPSKYLNVVSSHLEKRVSTEASVNPNELLSPKDSVSETENIARESGLKGYLKELILVSKWHVENHVISALYPLGGGERTQAFANNIGIPILPVIVAYFTFGLIILGYCRWMFLEGLSAFFLFPILYTGMLIVWGWDDRRFLYPIQPQLFLGLLLGIEAILVCLTSFFKETGFFRKFNNGMLVAFVCVLILISIYKDLRPDDTRQHVGDLQARTAWIKANTPPSAILMTEDPEIDYVYSDRKTIRIYNETFSAEDFLDNLLKDNVNYVLLAPKVYWQTNYTPAYSANTKQKLLLLQELASENRAELVYSSEKNLIRVYKILP